MLMPRQTLSVSERQLIKYFSKLDEQRQSSLLDFAAFLAQQNEQNQDALEVKKLEKPKAISRPEQESVVAAIKRLSANYFMLERSELLTEASTLMTEHVMRGRASSEVIDDLEQLFARHYQSYLDSEVDDNAD